MQPETFEYFINLDERGEFYADVRDCTGETILEIEGDSVFEDGWMKHNQDLDGLKEYLCFLAIAGQRDTVKRGN